jgi:UDP-N-acetylmuramate dehydrogenase
MNPALKKELQHLDSADLEWNVSLAGHTSLRVGGPVSCLISPVNLAGLRSAVQVLNSYHYPYFVLGRGSNILASDAGVQAAALSLGRGFCSLERADEPGRVRVGAGLRLNRLLRFCLQEELSGLEFLAGIPGSAGGALRMNAGTRTGTMADVCRRVAVLLADGSLVSLPDSQLSFSYRRLELPPGAVLVEAELAVRPGSRTHIREQIRSLLSRRRASQPWRHRSAGSVFKNPPGDFAGRLIERSGLKGLRIGGAQISMEHANFIVNLGGATASDVLSLIERVRKEVAERFGIYLELEVHLVGCAVNSRGPDRIDWCSNGQAGTA